MADRHPQHHIPNQEFHFHLKCIMGTHAPRMGNWFASSDCFIFYFIIIIIIIFHSGRVKTNIAQLKQTKSMFVTEYLRAHGPRGRARETQYTYNAHIMKERIGNIEYRE